MNYPWGIYIHVPWCRRRCSYCDFYFEVGKAQLDFGEQVLAEYHLRRSLWPQEAASTLYFGGGTPSLLPETDIKKVIAGLREKDSLRSNAEITIEANPEDITIELAKGLKAQGVNRISLGVQSFDDRILRKLGRKHSCEMALSAIESCLQAGFERISVDLIFGVPSEEPMTISESIRRLKNLGVGHVSAYLLTIEQGTSLFRQIEKGRSPRPDDDQQADAYEEVQKSMGENGYIQYEVSSYSVPGQESRHNRNYWGKGPYLGLGPAAHSLRLLLDGRMERAKNPSSIQEWRKRLSDPQELDTEVLSTSEAFLESVAFGLRDLLVGVNLELLETKHQCLQPKGLADILRGAISKGWVHQGCDSNAIYYLTKVGVRFSDAIAREILCLS